MQNSAGPLVLRLFGALLIVAGFVAWIGLIWVLPSDLGEVSADSEEGGRLVLRLLVGAVLLILGMVLLHFAQAASEAPKGDPSR